MRTSPRPKVPAAEEQVSVTYILRELEVVRRSLLSKKYEYNTNPAKHERAIAALEKALVKTDCAIDITLHRRRNRDT